VAEQAVQEGLQVDAAIEAVGEGAEVLAGVLCEPEGFVGAADQGLQVAQNGVDPGEPLSAVSRSSARTSPTLCGSQRAGRVVPVVFFCLR
jgi:hypothetical protein